PLPPSMAARCTPTSRAPIVQRAALTRCSETSTFAATAPTSCAPGWPSAASLPSPSQSALAWRGEQFRLRRTPGLPFIEDVAGRKQRPNVGVTGLGELPAEAAPFVGHYDESVLVR